MYIKAKSVLSPNTYFTPVLYIPLVRLGAFRAFHVACSLEGDGPTLSTLYEAMFEFEDEACETLIPKKPSYCTVAGNIKLQIQWAWWGFTIYEPEPNLVIRLAEATLGPPVSSPWDTWVQVERFVWCIAFAVLGWTIYRTI